MHNIQLWNFKAKQQNPGCCHLPNPMSWSKSHCLHIFKFHDETCNHFHIKLLTDKHGCILELWLWVTAYAHWVSESDLEALDSNSSTGSICETAAYDTLRLAVIVSVVENTLSALSATAAHNIRLYSFSEWLNVMTAVHCFSEYSHCMPLVGVVVEYRTRNREVAGSIHNRSTASNLEQVANPPCAQANSASYPQQDGNE